MKTKRKVLSVLMTLAMVVSMIPAFGVTASAEEKPTKIISVTWNEDYSVTFTTDNSAVGGDYWYGVFSEKDGNMHVSKWTQPGDISFNGGTATVTTETMNSMLSNLKENGKYYVGVWFKEDTDDTRVQSAARMITLQRLPAPKNMHWEGTVAKWDPVEGAAGYFLQIYSDNSYITYVETNDTEKDLSSYISVPPAHTYRFDMQALGSSFDKASSETVKGPEKRFEKIPLTFKAQPESGTCDRENKYHFTWVTSSLDSTISLLIEAWAPSHNIWIVQEDRSGYGWGEVSYAKGLTDENNVSRYRLHAVGSDGEEAYSNEFTVKWTKSKPDLAFTIQPKSGSCPLLDKYGFTWELTDSSATVILQVWIPKDGDWGASSNLTGKTSYEMECFNPCLDENSKIKYRLHASTADEDVYSDEFTVKWGEADLQINPFEDIYESDEYYNAVLWAYYASPQVTNGMDETHFGPNLTVTRAQAVTFLWRSQGCPEPSTTVNPFVDVPSTEYYYKPVLWAVENNITKGTTDTTFDPGDTLTTAHIVTFLYRTKNPGMDGWYGEAAAWAADENGRPFGVDIAVDNTTNCPRCNVVQFLYKLSK